ncbi:DNA-dirted DNA polymerase III [Arthrobacter sp. PAMC 25486]|uniref:DNA polymerase III subunit gamma and tau n=1 Tax=Arthrobacter sp. PAMC 25486 TaxID=1494608 RepID=UPI0005361FA3|nr:DNA polymerase III subunit gamma and tau [Arthrobacter sp. PAMC 25486]AIY01992.1 DNA-dirted DNA polymerase III [Arthrobacter sp. PAMC 25486]
MSAPTALYRRYRPDSFATVIGQEHVTAPLMAALEKNRVNHAYLFSGPRGCGKTTSARILARCLNCAKGPTSHPCGECDSCVELARGGTGSLDVIEIDAASHGGVDDARDLRERATFAPIRDRYKIFIIDEAHMVTSAGFNALLKIVEEPPEHIKFIFATTEPDKVIGTIRSRTHHYPFRLVPPEPLMAYLAQLCEQEGVAVAPGVLSLVVRAGGGSVRDSLSVLDQLMAGAGESGLDYDLAVDLLGYTHSSLLDDVVEALAAADSATVFKSVDRVIQTGHDPRRFVEDLLERFRDLIIVQAMPESAHAILRGTPDELIARMQTQAAQLGAAELSRAADVTNAAFNEMTGASSPRLHLELLGARLLLPGADASARGMATRLDQLERRLNYSGTPVAPAGNAPPAPAAAEPSSPTQSTTAAPADSAGGTSGGGLAAVRAQLARAKEAAGAEVTARHAPGGSNPPSSAAEQAPVASAEQAPEAPVSATAPVQSPAAAPPASEAPDARTAAAEPAPNQPVAPSGRSWDDLPTPSGTPSDAPSGTAQAMPAQDQSLQQQAPQQAAVQQPAPQQQAPAASHAPTSSGIEVIRRAWPEVLGSLRNIRMASWVIVNQNVVPQTFDGQELRVGLPSTGLISAFSNGGHLQNLQQAINEVLGLTISILPVDGEAPKASAEPNPKVRTGNPSPQREGNNGHAALQPARSNNAAAVAAPAQVTSQQATSQQTPPAQAAPDQAANQPAPAAAQAAPARAQAAPAPTPTPAPAPQIAAQQTAAETVAPQNTAAQAASQHAAPSPQQGAANPQASWDGPAEPSDSWGEPYADPYAGEEPYPAEDAYTAEDPYASVPPHGDIAPAHGTPRSPAAPSAPMVHTPPKVSPIAAWTTGWDAPVAAAVVAAPAAPESPRRSELLAQQIAAQENQPGNQQPAPQDWGVSLGQGSRTAVADPGWGSISNAPDWAQDGPATDNISDSAPGTPSAATPGEASGAPSSATPGVIAESATGTMPAADDVPFNAALPVAGQPLGASAAYPTPAAMLAPAPSEAAVQEQEGPASGMEPGEKLTMYQRLSNSSEAQAGRAKAPATSAQTPYVEDVPSPDDVTIEESGVVGQAAVERILGGVLIEERSLNPNS